MKFFKKSSTLFLLSIIFLSTAICGVSATKTTFTSSGDNTITLSDNENPSGMLISATYALTNKDYDRVVNICNQRRVREITLPYTLNLTRDFSRKLLKTAIKILNSIDPKTFVEISIHTSPFCNPVLTVQDIIDTLSSGGLIPQFKDGGIRIEINI